MIKVNRKKSTIYKKLAEMKKRAQAAHLAKVSTGINAGEGNPSSGIGYADLMVIHHNGVASMNIPPRPVLAVVVSLYMQAVSKKAKHNMFKYLDGQQTLDPVLSSIGKTTLKYTKDVFGSQMLQSNAPATIRMKGKDAPLIESGELYDHLSYSYSWKGGERKGYETM